MQITESNITGEDRSEEVYYRPLYPGDAEDLQELLGGLSEESVIKRFFTRKPVLSDKEAQHFASVDHATREAIGVMQGGYGGKQILGVARYDKLIDNPTEAEFAIVVTDEWQRQGLGTELMKRLIRAANMNGIENFRTERLSTNIGVGLLMRKVCGDPVSDPEYEGCVTSEKWPVPELYGQALSFNSR